MPLIQNVFRFCVNQILTIFPGWVGLRWEDAMRTRRYRQIRGISHVKHEESRVRPTSAKRMASLRVMRLSEVSKIVNVVDLGVASVRL